MVWAEQQFNKLRVKRDHEQYQRNIDCFRRLVAENKIKSIPDDLIELWNEEDAMDEVQMPARKDDMFNDELWDHQWYLHDTRYLTQDLPDISLHVENVWREGIAGNGIRVVVIDDGLDHSHPDLIQNYDKDIRYQK